MTQQDTQVPAPRQFNPKPFDADAHDFVYVISQDSEAQSAPQTRTVRYDIFVKQLFKADTAPMMALHAALGLCGEVAEFVQVAFGSHKDMIEELGDIEFYTQAIRLHYNFSRLEVLEQLIAIKDPSHSSYINTLCITSGEIADCIKREYIYNKPRNIQAVAQALRNFEDALYNAYLFVYPGQGSWEEKRKRVLQANADKLAKRYVSLAYSDQAAINRADKAQDS